jgi:predicted methyltransferase
MRIQTLCLVLSVLCGGCATSSNSSNASPRPASQPTNSAPIESSEQPSAEKPEETAAVPAELNARYNKETSVEGWVERFEREGREVHDRKADVIAALHIEPGQVVADIGAGTGLYTLDFARAVGPQGRVKAVDVQDYFLKHLQSKAADAGLKNVDTVQATQKSAQLDADSVDLAFFCDAFHHVEYPRSYLASVFDAVKPGGRVAIIEFIRPDEAKAGPDDKWLLDHVRASPQQFREEFEAAGFVLQKEHDLLKDNFFFVFEKPQ